MATEARRGCGYRKAGGVYVRGDLGGGIPGVPVALHCSVCHGVPVAKAVANGLAHMGREWQRGEQLVRDAEDAIRGKERKSGPRKLAMKLRTSGNPMHVGGVFHCFTVSSIEVMLPASVAWDPTIQRKCAAREVNIVSVPDDDRDHVQPGWKLPAFLDASDEAANAQDGATADQGMLRL